MLVVWLPPKILGSLLEKMLHPWGNTIALKWTIKGAFLWENPKTDL